ncbi:MAG: DUF3558 family protein [Acidimicrobiia bacterium]
MLVTSSASGAGAAAKKKPPKPLLEACKVVTQADAATFLNLSVTQSGSGTSCDYAGAGGVAAITVRIMSLSHADVAFTKKQIKAANGAKFPKLGDVASESITPGGGGAIEILDGKVLLDISARKSDSAGNLIALDPTAFAAFAKAALAKMTAGGSSSSATSSSSSSGSAAGAQLDPCQLLTPQEVAAVLGGTVTANKAGPQDCEFTNNGGKTIHVAVSIGTSKYETDAKHFTGTAVSGIGDAAFLAQPNGLIGFKKGQYVVEMQTSSALVSPDDVTGLENLAKAAAARA